jgi:hypothetical protein
MLSLPPRKQKNAKAQQEAPKEKQKNKKTAQAQRRAKEFAAQAQLQHSPLNPKEQRQQKTA